jgi:hypothetical protein
MLIPFHAWHVSQMNLEAKAGLVLSRPGAAEALDRLEKSNNAMTLVFGDKVLGVIGVVPQSDGVGEVFVVATDDQKDHPVSFARSVKKELLALRAKFHRIQAVAVDDDFHARWLSWLGFRREGMTEKYVLTDGLMAMWSLI